jgi:hypothetical protein
MGVIVTEILSVLALIAQNIPAGSVANIINLLNKLIELGTAEVEAVLPEIKNIIAALQSNQQVTPEQMAQLQMLDAQSDAALEAVAAADGLV